MFFGSVEKPPRLSEFELEVPEKLIAKDPLKISAKILKEDFNHTDDSL